MHFRVGGIASACVGITLLRLAEQRKLSLDDPLSRWYPRLPQAATVTLRMLANCTSGYPDYVRSPNFIAEYLENPFRQWRPQELIDFGLSTPLQYRPRTNEISRKIHDGLEPAEYNRIKAPTLGIFFPMTSQYRHAYYAELDRTKQEEYDRTIKPLAEWIGRAIQRFRDDVKGSKVVELPETCHYVFIKDEARVVREMCEFLEK